MCESLGNDVSSIAKSEHSQSHQSIHVDSQLPSTRQQSDQLKFEPTSTIQTNEAIKKKKAGKFVHLEDIEQIKLNFAKDIETRTLIVG